MTTQAKAASPVTNSSEAQTEPQYLASNLTPLELETVRRLGIGGLAKRLMLQGHSNVFVLVAVKAVHPKGRTSNKSIQWTRNKLRDDGYPILTSRELKRLEKRSRRASARAARKARR